APRASALRIYGPALLLAALVVGPWASYRLRPARPLALALVDKTVPFRTRVEHRSLYWLLDYLRIVRPDGAAYDRDADYLGAFPGPRPGDPPERTTELTAEAARAADVVYLADTYGVYRDDLKSGPQMKAALERSPKIYGGLTLEEARAAISALERGKLLIAEFNTLGSPTERAPREALEGALGVRWTHWIGRHFPHLEDPGEVPQWLRRDYEQEWKRPWQFRGAGYVLVQDDAHVEVLRYGIESPAIGLTIERARPHDPLLAHTHDGIPYPYWFDVVETAPGAVTLASFRWSLKPDGHERLRARGLPASFPAVVRRRTASGGIALYFAGDFADNPLRDGEVPFSGYLMLRRRLEALRLVPSEEAFYWRFYVPLMDAILTSHERKTG
ncbi:MAG TPA: hypothetical protein VJS92_16520, partial [Candidatus Polarisedimenticolaceae bacterium]|nr:hypothetical protein [Candidatus Polarisedimenticolaceae bacterium]